MKKTSTYLVVCIGAVVIVTILFAVAVYMQQATLTNTNSGVNSQNINTAEQDSADNAVEYTDAYGSTCPLGVHFLKSRTSPTVDCQCPAGYSMQSRIIGGEECYDGAECPILSVTCEAE